MDPNPDATADATPDSDTVEPAACDPYPIEITADPEAKTRAQAALATLAPEANLDWDDLRGTLRGAYQINLPMPDCTGDTNLYDEVWKKLNATPDLFQLVESEWDHSNNAPCRIIGEDIEILNMGRKTFAGQPVRKDVFAFVVAVRNNVVTLVSTNGVYLPPASPELTARLAACPGLDTAAALEALSKVSFPFTTFDKCVENGDGEYSAHEDDTLEFDDTAYWVWDDDPVDGVVRFTKQLDARLIIAEANRTPDLLASDANCPAEPPAQGRVIGFRITYDAVTGELLVSLPGVGCIVC